MPEDPRTPGPDSGVRFIGFGVQLAVTVAAFAAVGYWLDGRLGTSGILTMVGALLGFGAALYALVRALNRKDPP